VLRNLFYGKWKRADLQRIEFMSINNYYFKLNTRSYKIQVICNLAANGDSPIFRCAFSGLLNFNAKSILPLIQKENRANAQTKRIYNTSAKSLRDKNVLYLSIANIQSFPSITLRAAQKVMMCKCVERIVASMFCRNVREKSSGNSFEG